MIGLPEKIPGLRWLTILLAAYFVVWIVLEGDLGQTVLLGVASCVTAAARLIEKVGRGRVLSRLLWLLSLGLMGLLIGAGSVVATLAYMALKTGLHAHGPEFTPTEIAWVWGQLPLWSLVGGLIGLGLAALYIGMNDQ
ncbi:MAG: hypothetical protein KJ063_11065 [Anaerolineae bacterium]|nr:hypothetical protein [Anaerolineae bacterium]